MSRRTREWLADPDAVRRGAYGVAGFFAMVGFVSAAGSGTGFPVQWTWMVVPIVLLTAAALPHRRALVFAVAALALALPTGSNTVYLGFSVMSCVFLAIVAAGESGEPRWLGWASGLAGSVGSIFVAPMVAATLPFDRVGPNLTPFIFVAVGFLFAQVYDLRRIRRKLKAETDDLRGEAAWLRQRTALARELHDVVGHHVTAMVVQAEAGQVGDPEVALRAIADSGRTALGELDTLVVNLRDPDAEPTLKAPPRLSDIDELLAEPLRLQGVSVQCRIDPAPGLDELGVLTAYRIAQETLTNIARHARASGAWVELTRVGDRMRLRVSDDGVGPPAGTEGGSGLVGIGERVAAVKGSWDISERPGGGTMVEAYIPVDAT